MMKSPFSFALLSVLTAVVALASPKPADPVAGPGEEIDFSAQIRPILSAKCLQCHGPDEGSRKAKLRLDSFEEATQERKGGRPVVPGDVAASELVRRITTHDADEVMPPPETKNPLKPEEVDLLRRWVAQGGRYTPHWAWEKPRRAPLPAVRQAAWPRNGLDRFILARMEQNGLRPSAEADRHTLVRRLSLDLTGLPPSPDEVDAFVRDRSSKAYEGLVDRLLASPHFGERWARVWLDLARYADSSGYGSDPLRPNIWPWRDWLIHSLNRGQPFDEFTRDVIAGDLLPGATDEQRTATGFHRNTMTNTEGGTEDEEWRVAAVKDRANVTAQVWMGLTMGCAQCHTHKFDPITQREYYSFYAFFNQTEDNDQPDERPTLPLLSASDKTRRAALASQLAGLEADHLAPAEAFDTELEAWAEVAARPVTWQVLTPVSVRSAATNAPAFAVLGDGSVLVSGASPAKDTYTVTTRTKASGLTAFRLEALTDGSLPKNGPGRKEGEGNFVLEDVRATVRSTGAPPVKGRFVRVEAPGKSRHLMLAEVQVFSGPDNVALRGQAKQSSTAFEGDAARAKDGNTDGNYHVSNSVSHTDIEADPWWEVDLGSEVPIDEVVLWNRTDSGGDLLAGSRIVVLDASRRPAWSGDVKAAPMPTARFGPNAARSLSLRAASADHEQAGFDAARAIDKDGGTGWAVGGSLGRSHALGFELAEPLTADGEVELVFTLKQGHGDQLTLGRFRLSATAQAAPVRIWPAAVQVALDVPAAQRTEAQRKALADLFRPTSKTKGPVVAQIAQVRAELDGIKGTPMPVMKENAEDHRRVTRVLSKGNYLVPGDEVAAAVPAAFNAWPSGTATNRLGLAAWLTSPENPLTARVMVNRFWAQLMGQALVETEEDFGTQGTLPADRDLLDWLAVSFQAKRSGSGAADPDHAPALGWDFKGILKLVVMSATYRQSSVVTPALLERDPRNRFYARAPRRRLDAEGVRDQALALSGLLSRKVGGASVYPAQPDGLWRAAFNGERTWRTSSGEDRYRRGLYTFWRRTVPYPSMAAFDAPSRESCTVRRLPTNTPLQAFVTLNDPVFVECAQALGRDLALGEGTVASRVARGLKKVLARPVADAQVAALVRLFEQERDAYGARAAEAAKLGTVPLGPLPDGLAPADAAAWTTVANVLLNLDGVLTKG